MSYVEEMFSLEGQTAVITGGAGAIGTVMSDALLRAGANVVVWSRTQASIDPFMNRYENEHSLRAGVHGIQVNTGIESEVTEAFNQSAEHFDLPEILVNGVGGNKGKMPLPRTRLFS